MLKDTFLFILRYEVQMDPFLKIIIAVFLFIGFICALIALAAALSLGESFNIQRGTFLATLSIAFCFASCTIKYLTSGK